MRWVISKRDGAPNFAMRVFEVETGAASPFHTHPWEHEVFILDGKGHIRDEEGEMPFQEEDAVFVAPEEKHQFVNDGARPCVSFASFPYSEGFDSHP